MAKVYALILWQCSPTICDQIKVSTKWVGMSNALDALHLLAIICQSLYHCANIDMIVSKTAIAPCYPFR